MAVKSVNITIVQNGLGTVPPGGGQTIGVVGVSSAGTANTCVQSSNPADFVTSAGYGSGIEAAGFVAHDAGNNVIFAKAATVNAGTNSGITHVGTGASVMSVTGTPLDTYYILVTVTTGIATVGTAGAILSVSLDAGRTTYSTCTLGTGSTYLIPNTGLTLNFTSASLVALDTYSLVSIEPKWSTATLTSACDALLASGLAFKNVLIVGDCASGDVATVQTEMNTYFTKKQFNRCFTNARDAIWGGTSTETASVWKAAIIADFISTSADCVSVAGGFHNIKLALYCFFTLR